jgi:hypothetical protein
LKAVIPFLQRLLQWLGVHAIFGKSVRTTLVTSALWVYIDMYGVLFYIRIYFWKVPTGTATVLSKDEKQTMKAAQKAVLQEPSTSKSSRTPSTITGREGFEEEKSSVDFDNELLPRD